MQRQIDALPGEANVASMAVLYQHYSPALFAYLLRNTRSQEDAEDILIEVFLAALETKAFSSWPEKTQLAWLWRVARNKMIDGYRRSARRPGVTLESVAEHALDDESFAPEEFVLQQEEYEHLQDHLKQLPALQQEVLRLRFGEEMRCSEIAAHLDKREGAVKVMLSRTLNLLKRIYEA